MRKGNFQPDELKARTRKVELLEVQGVYIRMNKCTNPTIREEGGK